MHFIHFLPKLCFKASGADGVRGGGGTSNNWLTAALRSVQSEIHMNIQENTALLFRVATSCAGVSMCL